MYRKSDIKTFWKIEFEDNAFVILKSNNNLICPLHSSATQWKHKFNLEIILEKGYIILDGCFLQQEVMLLRG